MNAEQRRYKRGKKSSFSMRGCKERAGGKESEGSEVGRSQK